MKLKVTMRKTEAMRIDLHSHVIPTRIVEALLADPATFAARGEGAGAERRIVHAQGYAYPLVPEFFDPVAKLASMDRKGIDVSVISPAPPMFYYWADADLALRVAGLVNDGVADMVAHASNAASHGGGFAPYQIGRLVHGHKVRTETHANSKTDPGTLLRRFYFDSLVFEPRALRYLIDLVGADRVVIGTDSPFDMADAHPLETLNAVCGLTHDEHHEICCGTALRLLGEGRGSLL